jgi:hypothetical protein
MGMCPPKEIARDHRQKVRPKATLRAASASAVAWATHLPAFARAVLSGPRPEIAAVDHAFSFAAQLVLVNGRPMCGG